MYVACLFAVDSQVNGNFFIVTYALITVAELWVSAVGLSMIGLYCNHRMIGFAMGVWLIASSLSNILSAQLAQVVALPSGSNTLTALHSYKMYYFDIGSIAIILGVLMWGIAVFLTRSMKKKGILLA